MKNEIVSKTKKSSDAELRRIRAVTSQIKRCTDQTGAIRANWADNQTMFRYGSQFTGKQPWQSEFSVNNFAKSIRAAQGHMVNTLVNQPDWWDLTPKNARNQRATFLARPIKALLNYHLEAANFKRHAGTFLMQSLISLGIIQVGFTKKMVLNPEWVLEKTKQERRKEQSRLSRSVANPETTDDTDLAAQMEQAIEELMSEAQGEPPRPAAQQLKQYIQYGCLDFKEPIPDFFYYEPTAHYMQESSWCAFEYQVTLSDLKQQARIGYLSKSAVKRVSPAPIEAKWAEANQRYKGNQENVSSDKVTITVYYGPLIEDGEIVKDMYFAIIANGNVILKDGDYPYWEPPGHRTPVVAAAVRQIPFSPTGAGIGDNAKQLQRQMDSNLQLQCDSWRLNIGGINVVNRNSLVDKSQLDEGIYPGKTIEVRDKPRDAFERVTLTSNVENQVAPINEVLRNAIDDQTGNMDAVSSGPNLRSRTSAAEIDQRVSGAQSNLNIMALDLEQDFLIPVLQKCLARILQFGLGEIQSNAELRGLFEEEELQALLELSDADRLEVIQSFFKFEIDGFSANQDRKEKAARLTEFMQVGSSNPLLNAMVNWPELITQYARQLDMDPNTSLVVNQSEAARIVAENQVLMQNALVLPSPQDNDEMHMQQHAPLAGSPFATQALQQHVQMHQQQMMQKQAQAEQGQEQGGGEPPAQ